MDKWDEKIAILASEWATLLHCRRTCATLKHEKREARKRISFMMCPKGAKDLLLLFKSLIKTSESPSRKMLSNPSSRANSTTRRAARVSTSMTIDGSGIISNSEAITIPSWFRITTPKSALFSCSKISPSKSIL